MNLFPLLLCFSTLRLIFFRNLNYFKYKVYKGKKVNYLNSMDHFTVLVLTNNTS